MASRIFGFLALAVGCIALADLVIHPAGTSVLTSSAVTAEKTGTNALLGQTTK
jgi:hypothetical protein